MENNPFLIVFLIIGPVVGVLLAKLRHKGIVYGLLMGLFLNIIGWAIMLISDDKNERKHENENGTKIARIVVGSILTVASIISLIKAFSSPIPTGVDPNRVIYTFLLGVALSILGIVLICKGIIKKPSFVKRWKNKFWDIDYTVCKQCGKEISNTLDKCPFCGTPTIKPLEEAHEE